MMTEINILPHVKAGKLILLNMNHAKRHPEFPDVPTLTELGYPDSDVPIWFSLWAPAGTPAEAVQKLNARIVEIAKSPEMKARMIQMHVDVPVQTPEEMGRFLAEDIKRNGDVIKAANIKIE
jgi:tripartite-type tricarboxylate transporter receptor subunit TctC